MSLILSSDFFKFDPEPENQRLNLHHNRTLLR